MYCPTVPPTITSPIRKPKTRPQSLAFATSSAWDPAVVEGVEVEADVGEEVRSKAAWEMLMLSLLWKLVGKTLGLEGYPYVM